MKVVRRRAWLEPMPGTRMVGVRPEGRLLLTPLLEVGVTAGGLVVAHEVSQAQAVWALLQHEGRTEVLGRALKVNGRLGREVTLADRDLLELDGAALRYREEAWSEPCAFELEAALVEEPGDRARWLVWADWLLEHGELSTGQRVVAQARTPEPLEGFAPLVAGGGLEVDWRNGFPFALKLACAPGARDLGVLLSVLGLPSLRFLHTLEVDVASFVRRPRPEVPSAVLQVQAAAAGVLSTLCREGLPSLRRLVLGPLWEGVPLSPRGAEGPFSPALEWLAAQERSLEPPEKRRLAAAPEGGGSSVGGAVASMERSAAREGERSSARDSLAPVERGAAREDERSLSGATRAPMERGAAREGGRGSEDASAAPTFERAAARDGERTSAEGSRAQTKLEEAAAREAGRASVPGAVAGVAPSGLRSAADPLARACPRLRGAGPGLGRAQTPRLRALWLEPVEAAQPRIPLQPGLRQDLGGIRLEFLEVGWAAVPALVAASAGAQLNGAPFGFGDLRMLREGDVLDGGHGLVFRVGVEWA